MPVKSATWQVQVLPDRDGGDLLPARLSQPSERRQRARSRTALAGAVRRRLMGAGRTQVDGLGHSGGPRNRHQQRQQRHSESGRRDAHQDPAEAMLSNPGPFFGHRIYRCIQMFVQPPANFGGKRCLKRTGSLYLYE